MTQRDQWRRDNDQDDDQEYGQRSQSGYRDYDDESRFQRSRMQGRNRNMSDYSTNRNMNDYDRNRNMNDYDRNRGMGDYTSNRNMSDYDRNRGMNDYTANRNMSDYDRNRNMNDYDRNMGNYDRLYSSDHGNQSSGTYGSQSNMYGNQSSGMQGNQSNMRNQRGLHTGKGPKGYQRSDERIREDVNEMLWQHGDIDASEVQVDVQNGEVTLRGTVDSRRTKHLAEDAIEQVSGVKDVHNQLRVEQTRTTAPVDVDTMQQRAVGGTTTNR